MDNVLEIIRDRNSDIHEKRALLAAAAENSLPYPPLSDKAAEYLRTGIIHDLNEGHAPCRPRYILPDYALFMQQGSEYLSLTPPADMYEAVNALLILYRFVPSITGYPVYLGQVDELLEPYKDTVGEAELTKLLRMFLVQIDRVLPDAFVHMNIGPRSTTVGKQILRLERELKKAVPNLSLKLAEDTPDDMLWEALSTALETGKPYLVNHGELSAVWGENYGIASCYNTLMIGGGSHTLVRLNLKEAALQAHDYRDFLERVLPETIACLCEVINARARFVVEEARFFETSFLAREGLVDVGRFTSMAGVYGLYECVEILSGGLAMGANEQADTMAEHIVEQACQLVKSHDGLYCGGMNGKIGFHAQSGIDSDQGVTPGVRFRAGTEPGIFSQIRLQSSLQRYFDTGVSDIYVFDQTARGGVVGLTTLVRGAMRQGMRIMSLYADDSELVRITGYLVKRSDIEKYHQGQPLREGTVKLGARSVEGIQLMNRPVREVEL